MSDSLLSVVNIALHEIYLPALRDQLATNEIRMHQMWNGGRMPPIRWNRITMLEPWWPARALDQLRRWRSFLWGRAAETWEVLLHGIPPTDW